MRNRTKTPRTLGEHAIFGDEEAAQLRSELDELRTVISQIQNQLQSQFTTIAAHAEIAREQSELARGEARADLERTREALIGLLEQLRNETLSLTGHHVPGSAPGPSTEAQNDRLRHLEASVDELTQVVGNCFTRQRELADTMAALIDNLFAERRGEPVAGLTLT